MIQTNPMTGGTEWVPSVNGNDPKRDFMKFVIWMFVILIALFFLSSCTTTRKVQERDAYITSMTRQFEHERMDYAHRIDSLRSLVIQRDSTIHRHEQRDSVWQSVSASDSLMVRDSVHVSTDADGRTLEQHYHWEYRMAWRDRIMNIVSDRTDITEQYSYLTSQLLEMTLLQAESHDSIVWLQDSLASMSHTQEKVIVRSNRVVEFLAAVGIVALAFLLTFLLLKFRILF